jgi:hypothetical protein
MGFKVAFYTLMISVAPIMISMTLELNGIAYCRNFNLGGNHLFMKRRIVVFSLYFQLLHTKLFSFLVGRERLVQFVGKHEEGSFGFWKQQVGWFQIWSKKRWSHT